MPDIAMCDGKRDGKMCPRAETCYRFTATPNAVRQSYLAVPPFTDEGCGHFWPTVRACLKCGRPLDGQYERSLSGCSTCGRPR